MVVATGAVVQKTSVTVAKDEVLRHFISFGKKINTFSTKTTKENRIVLNIVQFNITFRITTVQNLLKKKDSIFSYSSKNNIFFHFKDNTPFRLKVQQTYTQPRIEKLEDEEEMSNSGN